MHLGWSLFGGGGSLRALGTSGGSGSKTPGKGLDGELCNGDLASTAQTGDIQNFAKGPGQVGIRKAGFPVLTAPPWSWSKAPSPLDASPEVEGGPR